MACQFLVTSWVEPSATSPPKWCSQSVLNSPRYWCLPSSNCVLMMRRNRLSGSASLRLISLQRATKVKKSSMQIFLPTCKTGPPGHFRHSCHLQWCQAPFQCSWNHSVGAIWLKQMAILFGIVETPPEHGWPKAWHPHWANSNNYCLTESALTTAFFFPCL